MGKYAVIYTDFQHPLTKIQLQFQKQQGGGVSTQESMLDAGTEIRYGKLLDRIKLPWLETTHQQEFFKKEFFFKSWMNPTGKSDSRNKEKTRRIPYQHQKKDCFKWMSASIQRVLNDDRQHDVKSLLSWKEC